MKAIHSFDGEYSFLSNFFESTIKYHGLFFATNEHAFQAEKTHIVMQIKDIQNASTPGKAKRLGRKATLREDWEDIKLHAMEDICRIKFTSNDALARLLVNTGDAILVEGNNWNDKFWGQCPVGFGQNNLGLILMKIREELK